MIIVSSCLAGLKTRYDGTDCLYETIKKLVDQGKAIAVCPELEGGLTTPREPAEIQDGTGFDVLLGKAKVIEKSGEDVTAHFIKGAMKTLELARELNATQIVLKEYSPSCGSNTIYDGSFKGEKIKGDGVTAALLRKEGFKVISEEEFLEMLQD